MDGSLPRAAGAAAGAPPAAPAEGAAAPFTDSSAHLWAELSRIDLLVRMQAIRARQVAGDDAFRGLAISDRDAFALFERPPGSPLWAAAPRLPEAEARLLWLGAEIERRREASLAAGVELRLVVLARQFLLDRFDLDLLLIALLPELDSRYDRLFAYLQDDVTRKRPSVELALALLCQSLPARLAARERLSPSAPLFRHCLLRLGADPAPAPPPLLQHYLQVEERIVDFLHGGDALDRRLQPYGRIAETSLDLDGVMTPAATKERIAAAIDRGGRPILHLQGPPGVGRRSLAGALAHRSGRRLLLLDGAALAALPPAELRSIAELTARESRLQPLWPLVERFDALLGEGARVSRELLLDLLRRTEGPLFVAGEAAGFEVAGATVIRIPLPVPTAVQRADLWARALAAGPALDERVDLALLSGSRRMSPGQIVSAAATAAQLAGLRSPGDARITAEDLVDACRRHAEPRLGALAQKISAAGDWDDLILPKDRLARLREIGMHARHRAQVLDRWGFARKLPTGRGLSALFCGPPGTGKTLAASVLARHLGLDLFQIDLSAVVSKYIGETEKHLAQLFAEAEGQNAVLFFDEADALFGKRGETRDAHDRYANQEVAYLLQRLDSYEGVVILATNLARNMDEAFVRRLRFIVDFPLPGESERRRIWERILPPELPRDPDLDLALAAKRFDLPGGYIRNMALAAAFLAADEGAPLAQRHLLRAARREYQKMGKIVDESWFAEGRRGGE